MSDTIEDLIRDRDEWRRVAAQREEQLNELELQLALRGPVFSRRQLEKRVDEAIELIVEVGGALDGAIASHLLPGVVGKNARQLSLKSRRWLAANARASHEAVPAEAMTATIAAAYGAGNDAAQARIRELETELENLRANVKALDLEQPLADQARARGVELLAGEALALWSYWCTHDITDNDDHWAEFTNAVHGLLAGKPVPKRFLRPATAQREVAVPRVRTRIQGLDLELQTLRANIVALDLEEPLAQQKRLAEATALLSRIVKYAREDRATTPRATRLARALAEAETLLSATPSPPAEPARVYGGEGMPDVVAEPAPKRGPERTLSDYFSIECNDCHSQETYENAQAAFRAFTAEPAPSLVEQIEHAVMTTTVGEWRDMTGYKRLYRILRAAREAGGR